MEREMTRAEVSPRRWLRGFHWEVVGLVGVLLAFLGFSLHYAFATEPLLPPDEQAHLAYGYAVAEGELPEIDSWDRFPASADHLAQRMVEAPDDRYRQVWVANHPPLYYVTLAPLLVATDRLGEADAGIMAARLLNIAFAAAGIGLTYLLATEVSGGVRGLGLVAAALAAFVVQAQYTFSHAYNDGLALFTITLMLWAALRCLRPAHPRGGALLLSLSIAAAAATRAAGLILGVVVILAVVGARTLIDGRRVDRPAYVATMHAAILALPTVVLVGWFYVRNMVLYGDIGASSYLLNRFERVPRPGGLVGTALDGEMWLMVYDRMVAYIRFLNPVRLSPGSVALWRWGGLLALLGLLIAVAVGRTGGRRAGGELAPLSRAGVATLVLATAANAAVFVQHVAEGGSPWPRYLYPTLGTITTLAALGLHRLVPRILPLLVVAGAAATSWTLARPTERVVGDPAVAPWLLTASLVLAAVGIAIVGAVLAGWAAEPLLRRVLIPAPTPKAPQATPTPSAVPAATSPDVPGSQGTNLAPPMTVPIGAR
jgi:hypothetical protein